MINKSERKELHIVYNFQRPFWPDRCPEEKIAVNLYTRAARENFNYTSCAVRDTRRSASHTTRGSRYNRLQEKSTRLVGGGETQTYDLFISHSLLQPRCVSKKAKTNVTEIRSCLSLDSLSLSHSLTFHSLALISSSCICIPRRRPRASGPGRRRCPRSGSSAGSRPRRPRTRRTASGRQAGARGSCPWPRRPCASRGGRSPGRRPRPAPRTRTRSSLGPGGKINIVYFTSWIGLGYLLTSAIIHL